MVKAITGGVSVLVFVVVVVLLSASLYTVQETEQVIITQFGAPVGEPVTKAGLHFKTPFIQVVNRLEKRVMPWDGYPNEIQTRDKLFVNVDTYARWRIADPLLFFQRLRNEMSAQSRLDDILDGQTRNAIAKYDLLELIRSTNREADEEAILVDVDVTVRGLRSISVGRSAIAEEIQVNATPDLAAIGIELLDVRFKRINYSASVQAAIYERMKSERKQIADKFRAEGEGQAAEILGQKDRDLKEIESMAYRTIQEIRGQADARATEIYARAYNQSREAYDFYEFMKTMEIYRAHLDKSTQLMLSTDNDFFRYLQGGNPK